MRRALLLGMLLAAACATDPAPAEIATLPEARPAPAVAATPFPSTPTLADVGRRVEAVPAMEAARALAAAGDGRIEQADLPPNPMAGLSHRFSTAGPGDMTKTMLDASERIETNGKREARVAAARADRDVAESEVPALRLRLAGEAAAVHQAAAAAARLAAARRAALAVVEESVALARERVAAGRAPERDLPPLLAEAGRRRVAAADADREERTALRRLEGLLAVPPGSIRAAGGDLLLDADLPPPASVEFEDHPEIRARRAGEEAARAAVAREESMAVPDVTVDLGVERSREAESVTMIGVGVEMELPVFDRNQGAIRAARDLVRRARAETEAARARLAGDYAALVDEVRLLRENRAAYGTAILPALERDLALAEASRAAGRIDAAPVLAARLELAAARADLAELESRLAAATVAALALLPRGLT